MMKNKSVGSYLSILFALGFIASGVASAAEVAMEVFSEVSGGEEAAQPSGPLVNMIDSPEKIGIGLLTMTDATGRVDNCTGTMTSMDEATMFFVLTAADCVKPRKGSVKYKTITFLLHKGKRSIKVDKIVVPPEWNKTHELKYNYALLHLSITLEELVPDASYGYEGDSMLVTYSILKDRTSGKEQNKTDPWRSGGPVEARLYGYQWDKTFHSLKTSKIPHPYSCLGEPSRWKFSNIDSFAYWELVKLKDEQVCRTLVDAHYGLEQFIKGDSPSLRGSPMVFGAPNGIHPNIDTVVAAMLVSKNSEMKSILVINNKMLGQFWNWAKQFQKNKK
ncbi:MAG: trypsin-like serine protease [Gammaproteobacteria bacterium]|nr:trypsin-like serine protease [Gammaproteobacteria bacterium]